MTLKERYNLARREDVSIIGRFISIPISVYLIYKLFIIFMVFGKTKMVPYELWFLAEFFGFVFLALGLVILYFAFRVIIIIISWVMGKNSRIMWRMVSNSFVTVYKIFFSKYKGKWYFLGGR